MDLELEEGLPICRICLEPDNIDNMFSPCKCSGTQKYVHKKCLNNWRRQSVDNDNYKRCNECLTEFKFKKISSKKKFIFGKITKFIYDYLLVLLIFEVCLNLCLD